MTITTHAKPSKQKTMIAAAMTAGVLAAAGATVIDKAEPADVTKPISRGQSTPAIAALVTPNTLYAATGAPPIVMFGPNGSLGIGRTPAVAEPGGISVTNVAVPEPYNGGRDVKAIETFFAPAISARPEAARPGDDSTTFVAAFAQGNGPSVFGPTAFAPASANFGPPAFHCSRRPARSLA